MRSPKLHSTGALTPAELARQERRYAQGHRYDDVIIGTGVSALTLGALLANAGRRVCLIEAHDTAGGYAHTFSMGAYSFCAQVHYVWGCGPGDTVDLFLRRLGLQDTLTFELMDPAGYDRVTLPGGARVRIPYGFDRLADNIESSAPGSRPGVERFLALVRRIHSEQRLLPSDLPLGAVGALAHGWRFRTLLRYRNRTLAEAFDEFGLSREARAILSANAGDFGEPPATLSLMAYAGLMGGYNRGAYYPTRHFGHYVDTLIRFITAHDGCHAYFETEVSGIEVEGRRVVAVRAGTKVFRAERYICNADPQWAARELISWRQVPRRWRKSLSYPYSPSGIVVYLGLRGIDLREYGFGRHNTWHLSDWSMDRAWRRQEHGDFSDPWAFVSTASLQTPHRGTTPPGGQIMEIATNADFGRLRGLKDADRRAYRREKHRVGNAIIDLVERHYVPGLRKHIAVKVVGSPTTNEDYVRAPRGNAYGSSRTRANVNLGRLRPETPWENLWWCNASSGFPGFFGTTATGVRLYTRLTGDRSVLGPVPSDRAMIDHASAEGAGSSHRDERVPTP